MQLYEFKQLLKGVPDNAEIMFRVEDGSNENYTPLEDVNFNRTEYLRFEDSECDSIEVVLTWTPSRLEQADNGGRE